MSSNYHIELAGIGPGSRYDDGSALRLGDTTQGTAISGPTVSIGTNKFLYQQPSTVRVATPQGWWTNLPEHERHAFTFGGAVIAGALLYLLYRKFA